MNSVMWNSFVVRRGPTSAVAVALLAAIFLSACSPSAGGEPPTGTRPGSTAEAARSARAIPVAVEDAVIGSISSYYSATATLEAERRAQVLARVPGIVRELLVEEGDDVQLEHALLRIDDAEFQLKVEQAAAKREHLETQLRRIEDSPDLVTGEELDQTRNDLRTAKADEGLARLELSYAQVESPLSGRIVERLVEEGQTVNVGTPLFAVADFDPLLARVHVPAKEFQQLQFGQTVELVLDSTGERLRGTITLISPVIDPSTGTIKVTIEVPEYPDGIRPGDFAQVKIVTETHADTVLVPRGAVFPDKGDQIAYVAVREEDGAATTAERRIVEVGFSDSQSVEILSGIRPGESVVVKGQRSLKHGAKLAILTAELTPPPAAEAE